MFNFYIAHSAYEDYAFFIHFCLVVKIIKFYFSSWEMYKIKCFAWFYGCFLMIIAFIMRCNAWNLIWRPYLSLSLNIWDCYPLVSIFQSVTQDKPVCEIHWDSGSGLSQIFCNFWVRVSIFESDSRLKPFRETGPRYYFHCCIFLDSSRKIIRLIVFLNWTNHTYLSVCKLPALEIYL